MLFRSTNKSLTLNTHPKQITLTIRGSFHTRLLIFFPANLLYSTGTPRNGYKYYLLACCQRGEGYSIKFRTGRFRLEVQPLTLSHTNINRNDTPSIYTKPKKKIARFLQYAKTDEHPLYVLVTDCQEPNAEQVIATPSV